MSVASLSPGPDSSRRAARAFVTLGRIGFWLQFVLLIVVAILAFYVFLIVGTRAGIDNILAFLGLALPVFTTWWCWRYTRLRRRLAETPEAPMPARAMRAAWIGVRAGAAGVVVALVSLFGAASALLIVMLANPQVGIQVSPVATGASAYTISAVDAVSIMSLLITLTAELIVVTLSLRLAFLVGAAAEDENTRSPEGRIPDIASPRPKTPGEGSRS